jgi:hypothetical protein
MADDKALEKRVAVLEELLRRWGVPMPAEEIDDPTQRPDYIEPGSDRHLAFLGLERVEKDSPEEMMFETLEGSSGQLYRLIDPVGPFVGYADPKQAARLALFQKVQSFESGEATVHDKAPRMWVPEDVKPELAKLMRGR